MENQDLKIDYECIVELERENTGKYNGKLGFDIEIYYADNGKACNFLNYFLMWKYPNSRTLCTRRSLYDQLVYIYGREEDEVYMIDLFDGIIDNEFLQFAFLLMARSKSFKTSKLIIQTESNPYEWKSQNNFQYINKQITKIVKCCKKN